MEKTINKFIKVLLIVGFLGLTFLPAATMAVSAGEDIANQLVPIKDVYYNGQADPNPNTIFQAIANVVKIFLGLLGIIFIILIIYAGFLWMTAAGNEDRVSKAKKIMTAAIIGIAIILFAYIITFFVVDQLLRATGATDTGLN